MPFVKLDCGILESSLWPDKSARDVFITALLMARPVTILEPTPQYKVDCLDKTGWEAPPGEYGMVDASGSGILRRAMVEHDEGFAALERLGNPDSDSRTEFHEGRRMIRIDGGYLILNFMMYREKDITGAIRQARYRQRHGKGVTPLRKTSNAVTPLRPSASASASSVTGNGGVGEGDFRPEWEHVQAWLDKCTKMGSDYTSAEAHSAFLALQANGWMWGRNPVQDWRAAIERQIQTDRIHTPPSAKEKTNIFI